MGHPVISNEVRVAVDDSLGPAPSRDRYSSAATIEIPLSLAAAVTASAKG